MSELLVGIDLGGTNTKVGLFDSNINLLKKESCPTNSDLGPEHVVDRIGQLVESLFEDGQYKYDDMAGAGIGTPGPVDLSEGVVIAAPNLTSFNNVPIRKMLGERLGKPVVVENDANAACWGEHFMGAGRGVDDMVFVTLGTGIGGGVICNGEIVHGCCDDAAEIGHIIIYPDGRLCGCGQRGCVEAYASANSTVKRAVEAINEGRKSALTAILDNNGTLTCEDIYGVAAGGDELATDITDGTAKALGILCVNLLHFAGPRQIMFAGGMIAAGDTLLKRIQYYFNKYIWSMKGESVEICFATLGEDAGIIGCAALFKK